MMSVDSTSCAVDRRMMMVVRQAVEVDARARTASAAASRLALTPLSATVPISAASCQLESDGSYCCGGGGWSGLLSVLSALSSTMPVSCFTSSCVSANSAAIASAGEYDGVVCAVERSGTIGRVRGMDALVRADSLAGDGLEMTGGAVKAVAGAECGSAMIAVNGTAEVVAVSVVVVVAVATTVLREVETPGAISAADGTTLVVAVAVVAVTVLWAGDGRPGASSSSSAASASRGCAGARFVAGGAVVVERGERGVDAETA